MDARGIGAPAADFSPWVAEALAADDWDSVLEFLDFVATEHQITALRRTFRTFDFGRFVEADRDLLRFFAECGIFEAPTDLVAVGSRLTKEELVQIAHAHGSKAAKSWKKDRLIAAVLDSKTARASVSAKAAKTLMQVRREIEPAFAAWQARVVALRQAALALACA